jgi:acyl-CoA synthetase (AMP-forming)/AMP-acid ligase II
LASTTEDSRRLASIVDCVAEHARTCPDRPAIVSEDGAVTYARLNAQVAELAAKLSDIGVRKGDVVACLSYPRIDAYTLHLALISIGAIWLGINPKYKFAEMSYIVEDAKPVAIFFVTEMDDRDYAADVLALQSVTAGIEHVVSFDAPVPGAALFSELFAVARNGEDVCMIVYTSGSSGRPKGCLLRNKSMVHRGQTQVRDFDFSGDYPVVFNPWPMNHVGGIQLVAAYAMVAGGTMVFAKRFDAERIGKAVAENGINLLVFLPTMYHLMFSAESFDPGDFAGVELFVFSGGSMSTDQIGRLRALGQGKVQANYGLSEGHSTVTISAPGLDAKTLSVTMGRSRDGEVRVIDDEGRECTAVGQRGELQIKREYCMLGYLNRPRSTEEAFTADGWLKTGDKVEWLTHGELRFVGRMSEMYKSGGYNIYPREIEMCLEEHPDVGLAAVIKRPHEVFGEVGVAYVVPGTGREPPPETLREWCKHALADYKVPKDFIVSRNLPLLPNNKIDKVTLQARLAVASGGSK